MNSLRTAVIGVGYLGNFHAQKYASLPQSKLIGVCDADPDRAKEIAEKYHTQAFSDCRDLFGQVDAVSIAAPTALHYEIALNFLKNGVHVLLEKPMTVTLDEADELIRVAQNKKIILQVGHLERFNSALKGVQIFLDHPKFIESIRIAPFKPRGTDVNVVLDLMIHDIDIIQFLVKSDIKHISANGASVLTPHIDIANARLEFRNGAVANVTASRVSLKSQRLLRIFQHNAYLSLDLGEKRLVMHQKGEGEMFPGVPEIVSREEDFEQGDALKDQIDSFLNAILKSTPPVVSGIEARTALATAIEITQIMRQHNREYEME